MTANDQDPRHGRYDWIPDLADLAELGLELAGELIGAVLEALFSAIVELFSSL